MLIKFEEQVIDVFLIPEFTLSAGEIVVINFPNIEASYDITTNMNDLFSGKIQNDKVIVADPLTYVPHIKFNRFLHRIFPMTVDKWIRKHADMANFVSKDFYDEAGWLNPKISVDTLAGNLRRLLSVYCTLSKTKNIIFDLVGVDSEGGNRIFSLIKNNVKNGGAAIHYDYFEQFRNDCTTYLEAKLIDDKGNIVSVKPYRPEISFKKFTGQ